MVALLLSILTLGSGCVPKRAEDTSASFNQLALESLKTPLPPEKTEALLGEVGENWLYGPGLGETMLNVGAVVAFPPYAIMLLGNLALDLSGYETIGIGTALDEEERKEWESFYAKVVSEPGRVSAALAGEEFRSPEVARQRIERILIDEKENQRTKEDSRREPQTFEQTPTKIAARY